MIVKIISILLILVTVFLNFKHGWAGITNNLKPEEAKMMADLGLNKTMFTIVSVFSLAVCVLTLLPQTFFIGNIINAFSILLIMAFALRSLGQLQNSIDGASIFYAAFAADLPGASAKKIVQIQAEVA